VPSDLWFESDSGALAIYYDDGDSAQWVEIGGEPGPAGAPGLAGPTGATGATGATGPGVTISDTPPPTPAPSDLWFESDSGNLAIYYDDGDSAQWVGIGGSDGSSTARINDLEARVAELERVINGGVL
jgi:hypothetical protein